RDSQQPMTELREAEAVPRPVRPEAAGGHTVTQKTLSIAASTQPIDKQADEATAQVEGPRCRFGFDIPTHPTRWFAAPSIEDAMADVDNSAWERCQRESTLRAIENFLIDHPN